MLSKILIFFDKASKLKKRPNLLYIMHPYEKMMSGIC
jgi:hypothetical protein